MTAVQLDASGGRTAHSKQLLSVCGDMPYDTASQLKIPGIGQGSVAVLRTLFDDPHVE